VTERLDDEDEEFDQWWLAGTACLPLIAEPSRWVNRQVETIEMLSHEDTRRRVSIDFTLSAHDREALKVPDGVCVPIAVLGKAARRNFDMRDEGGRAVPVLGREQNSRLARFALLAAVADVIEPAAIPDEVFYELVAELEELVSLPADHAGAVLESFVYRAQEGDALRAAIWDDDRCRGLLERLWFGYIVFAVLPQVGDDRRILKFAYSERIPTEGTLLGKPDRLLQRAWGKVLHPDTKRFWLECPGAASAASFHTEVVIPEELRAETGVLVGGPPYYRALSSVERDVDRVSLYASEVPDALEQVHVYVEVATQRDWPVEQAAATALVVASLLWIGVLSELRGPNPGATVSLLLGGAALYSGLAAGEGKHQLVRQLFKARQRWLGLVTLAALVGSASLAFQYPCDRPVSIWSGAAVAATIAAARLLWSWFRAPR